MLMRNVKNPVKRALQEVIRDYKVKKKCLKNLMHPPKAQANQVIAAKKGITNLTPVKTLSTSANTVPNKDF